MQLPNQRHVPKRRIRAVHCHDRRDRHVRVEQRLESLGLERRDDLALASTRTAQPSLSKNLTLKLLAMSLAAAVCAA